MKRRPKQSRPRDNHAPAEGVDAILQVKVWLLGISPMVWRRVLVPIDLTLRELHGVIQVAMGWEGIHLYQFHLRAARYGSWELSAASPDVTLAALRFRKGARFIYEYDLNIPWRHEIRIEDRLEPEAGKTYPACTGGSGACPPEDCGGPAIFMGRRDDRLSFEALEDLDTMVEILREVALERRPEVLDNEETRWRLEQAVEHARRASTLRGGRFRGAGSTPAFAVASTTTLCTSSGDALRPALREQIGGQQRRFIPLPLPDPGDQRVSGRIGQLIEPALQRGGCRLGVKAGGGDALVAEETLQIGNVHAERQQPGRHRVTQQMWVDALADPGGDEPQRGRSGRPAGASARAALAQNPPDGWQTAVPPAACRYAAAAAAPGRAGSAPLDACRPCRGGSRSRARRG